LGATEGQLAIPASLDRNLPRIFFNFMMLELARMRWTVAGPLSSASPSSKTSLKTTGCWDMLGYAIASSTAVCRGPLDVLSVRALVWEGERRKRVAKDDGGGEPDVKLGGRSGRLKLLRSKRPDGGVLPWWGCLFDRALGPSQIRPEAGEALRALQRASIDDEQGGSGVRGQMVIL
jgi:hypothetical protein